MQRFVNFILKSCARCVPIRMFLPLVFCLPHFLLLRFHPSLSLSRPSLEKKRKSWIWVAATAFGDMFRGWGTLIKRPIYSSSSWNSKAFCFLLVLSVSLHLSSQSVMSCRAWLTSWAAVMRRSRAGPGRGWVMCSGRTVILSFKVGIGMLLKP